MLQGDETQAGQQCACPYCKTLFLVPQPMVRQPIAPQPIVPQFLVPQPMAPQPMMPQPVVPPIPLPQPVLPVPVRPSEVSQPPGIEADEAPASEQPADFLAVGPPPLPMQPVPAISSSRSTKMIPSVVHVLCPNGHALETPREMLGQDAICPHCDSEFRLCYETSIEYRKEKEEQEEDEEIEVGNLWLNVSIIAAVVVILGIVFLIVMAQQ